MSIIGIFCEDIRVEKNDIITLIGLLPDNVRIQKERQKKSNVTADQSRWLNKLCIYARANFDPDDPVKKIEFRLVLPNGEEVALGGATPELIEQAKQNAKANGGPLAGIITHSSTLFNFPGPGLMKLEAIVGAERRLIASLNFQEVKEANASTAPEPPS